MGSGAVKEVRRTQISSLERLDFLEKGLRGLGEGVVQGLTTAEERIRAIEDLVSAMMNVVGADLVMTEVIKQQQAAMDARVEAARAGLKAKVDAGVFLLAEVLPSSEDIVANENGNNGRFLIAGDEIGPDGSKTYVQLPLSNFSDESRPALGNKKVGDKVELTGTDKVLDIHGIYVVAAK